MNKVVFWKFERSYRRAENGCWLWQAGVDPDGRPWLRCHDTWLAVNVAYAQKHGREVPPGMFLRHTCGEARCVNPDHLELCGDQYAEVKRCRNGHPYTFINSYVDKDGYNKCRICRRAQAKRYRQNKGRTKNPAKLLNLSYREYVEAVGAAEASNEGLEALHARHQEEQ